MEKDSFNRNQLEGEFLKDFGEEEAPAPVKAAVTPLSFFKNLSRRHKILAVGALVVFAFFWLWAVSSDKLAISKIYSSGPPLILAPELPVRYKPEDPGGLQIANRDKRVYDAIDPYHKEELPKVIHILPQPEDPLNTAALGQDMPSATREMPAVENVAEEEVKWSEKLIEKLKRRNQDREQRLLRKKQIEQQQKALEIAANKLRNATPENMEMLIAKVALDEEENVTSGNEKTALRPEDIKVISSDQSNAEGIRPPQKQNDTGYFIQLGAYRVPSEVDTQWQRISKKYDDLLEGMIYKAQRADLGDKGVFYRLKVGPFSSTSKARTKCKQLKQKGQECFFVK